jgi:hypothetical protein
MMARAVAFIPDLLFGSQVQGALGMAGHEVKLVTEVSRVREALGDAAVLIVDLTKEDPDGVSLVKALADEGRLQHTRTLGFYSHVDAHVRERAQQAGFDLVVPRSRMAREGAQLLDGLAG